MRNPTPVTTSAITEESGSSCNPAGTRRDPAWIQGKRICTKVRPSAGREASDSMHRRATTKAAPTTAGAMKATTFRYAGASWWSSCEPECASDAEGEVPWAESP